jgi:hypothetical protein
MMGLEPTTFCMASVSGLVTGNLRAHGYDLSHVFRPRFFR